MKMTRAAVCHASQTPLVAAAFAVTALEDFKAKAETVPMDQSPRGSKARIVVIHCDISEAVRGNPYQDIGPCSS